jgi:hypothetical protein
MLQQHSLKHIVKMFGILLPNQTKFAILFLSLILTACGGTSERTTPLEEPVADGVAPSLTIKTNEDGTPFMREVFAKSVNKCNLGQKVAIDQKVLVQVSASESVLAPDVIIAGMPVAMSGTNYTWSGEFDMSQLPADSFAHGDNIPYEISVTDSSGQVSDPFKPAASAADALEFCDAEVDPDKCACYPEDISGVWKLAQKARAMGVGQSEGNTGDWSSTDFHLSQRDCVFDDTYTFVVDSADNSKKKGAFYQEMDGWTWLENWQSGDVERCGLPQTPFDGSNPDMSYVWDRELGTLTLKGAGAHIALPRVANDEENTGTPVEQVVYNLETANSCFMSFNIKSGGPSPWWHFEIEKADCEDAGDDSAPVVGAAPAPSITSARYDGMPATDIRLDMTAPFSSDSANEIQPTVTNGGTLFNVPAIYFVDPDGNGEVDNADAYAGFAHNPASDFKLYSYTDAVKGQAYLDAVAEDAAAATALKSAERVLESATTDTLASAEKAVEDAAILAKAAAKTLRDSEYYSNVLTFGSGGYIYFKGSVPNDGNVELYFKIDHYKVDALTGAFAINDDGDFIVIESFSTDVITMKGFETGFYGVKIDALESVGNNIAIFINSPDTDVVITDVRVITTDSLDEKNRGPYFFSNIFSGGPVGDDPDTSVLEVDAALGADGKLLGADNKWPEIEITNEGTTFMVPSAYFEDPDANGAIDNPGAYSGFGLDAGALLDLKARPLTFGENGKITFMASVQSGTADVRFRLERIGSEVQLEQEPSCTMQATSISGSSLAEYTVFVPVQGRRTFENVVMYIDTPDTEVTISNIKMETSPVDPTAKPIDCGSDAALYGDKELDMTKPYGDATVDSRTDDEGNTFALFRVNSETGNGYSGYTVKGPTDDADTILNIAPAAFGTAGKITFTASIPVLQQIPGTDGEGNPISVDLTNAQSAVNVKFRLERLGDDQNRSCFTDPSYDTQEITISGPEQEYTIDIPEQGYNTYQNFVMSLLTPDTQVKISNIILSTSPPTTDGTFVFSETCIKGSPLPSEYFKESITATDFDGDGISNDVDTDTDGDGTPDVQEDDPLTSDEVEQNDDYNYTIGVGGYAATFSGVYGKTTPDTSDTMQSADQFMFPNNSAHYGGWSNSNSGLKTEFNSTTKYGEYRIAFCASAPLPAQGENNPPDVEVFFKFENEAWPNNSQQVLTTSAFVPRDGAMSPYLVELTDNKNIAVFPYTHTDGTVTDAEFPRGDDNPDIVDLARVFTSLQMYIAERDVWMTVGKVYGNWNLVRKVDGTNVSNGFDVDFWGRKPRYKNEDQQDLIDGNYCDDFPIADTDDDTIKDNRDLYPNDSARAQDIDMDEDGIDDLKDGDVDGDEVINAIDRFPYDPIKQ